MFVCRVGNISCPQLRKVECDRNIIKLHIMVSVLPGLGKAKGRNQQKSVFLLGNV